ncbi:MAG: hypothetical protein LLG45_12545 [Actinomycetia bacterium]|nr:hypothetical protein [Actinomycetes bacterium]
MNNRMFDPGPRRYQHLIDRLDRQIGLKYRDHTTALDFTLKAAPPQSEGNEQEVLFRAETVIEAPQKEVLFPPDPLA